MQILISQQAPTMLAPYETIQNKHNASIVFRPFFLMEALTAKEFRAQRLDLSAFSAVVFTSRLAIDAYFKLAEETRFKVPQTMKYFCSTEAVAMYLQKHIIYRKRKIFYGNGSPESILELITAKHKDEKFLITMASGGNVAPITQLFDKAGFTYNVAVLVKAVSQDLKDIDIASYDIIVFYNQYDVVSLKENFPEYSQGKTKFVAFSRGVATALEENGFTISVKGPSTEVPSAANAIELCL